MDKILSLVLGGLKKMSGDVALNDAIKRSKNFQDLGVRFLAWALPIAMGMILDQMTAKLIPSTDVK